MDMSVWFLMGAALVFFMQCGFAMVEAGFTRTKNTDIKHASCFICFDYNKCAADFS